MREGWHEGTLDDVVAEMRNGVNCKQNKSGVGDLITRIETIADATFNLERVGYSILPDRDKSKYKLARGDILFSHINSAIHVGKTAIYDDDNELYHGVNLMLFRAHDFMNSQFLDYFLKMMFRSGYWTKLCKQSVNQASVNQKDIKKIPIKYPSLPEQKRIVAILDEAFEGIAGAIANAEKNLANARELFESYLNAVFTKKGEGWEEKTLSEVCSLVTDGKHGNCQNEENSGYYFLSAKDVKYGTLNFDNARQITKSDFEETHRRTNLKPHDICMVNTGATIGKIALAPDDHRTRRATFQKSVAIIKPIPSIIDNAFCSYHLRADLTNLVNVSSGSAQKNLLIGDLKKHLISLPSLDEQNSIVEKLDELSAESHRLEAINQQKLTALAELKQSILQKAFAGELTAEPSIINEEAVA